MSHAIGCVINSRQNLEIIMFYVYILSNPMTCLPFYVGVGKKYRRSNCSREQSHIREAIKLRNGKELYRPNKHKLNTILKILDHGFNVTIDIAARYDCLKDAFSEEIRLIALYGRADLGLGPLTNLTDGGQGGLNPSPLTRAKISQMLKGKPSKLKGRKLGPYSLERRNSLSRATVGRPAPSGAFKKGAIPWNKGLTKETSESVAKYSVPNPDKGFKKGHQSTLGMAMVQDKDGNKFFVSVNDIRRKTGELLSVHVGRPGWNKGKSISTKGKTYEEIYGPEKAAEMKQKRILSNIERWKKQKGLPSQ